MNKPKQKFYRVDEYQPGPLGVKTYFEPTRESAFRHVEGMKVEEDIFSNGGPGRSGKITTIQPFMSHTCDLHGWENSDFEDYDFCSYI
jgi:hypothetical protein